MARKRLRTSTSASSAGRVALAVTLGMVIGLLPKDSALSWAVMALAMVLPLPLAATLSAAIACTFLGLWLDPWTDQVGFWLLSHPGLHAVWVAINGPPLAVWLRLNNTVTVGSLVLALLATVPTYLVTGWVADRLSGVWARPPRRESLIPTLVTELDR